MGGRPHIVGREGWSEKKRSRRSYINIWNGIVEQILFGAITTKHGQNVVLKTVKFVCFYGKEHL